MAETEEKVVLVPGSDEWWAQNTVNRQVSFVKGEMAAATLFDVIDKRAASDAVKTDEIKALAEAFAKVAEGSKNLVAADEVRASSSQSAYLQYEELRIKRFTAVSEKKLNDSKIKTDEENLKLEKKKAKVEKSRAKEEVRHNKEQATVSVLGIAKGLLTFGVWAALWQSLYRGVDSGLLWNRWKDGDKPNSVPGSKDW